MLYQSDNLNFCFWFVLFQIYVLFQEIVLLNPGFIFSKILILSLRGKVTTGAQSLVLVIIKFAPVMLS